MSTPEVLNRLSLSEAWKKLGDKSTCPLRLQPFVGSTVIEAIDVSRSVTVLVIELLPGHTAASVFHLADSLASLFDLAQGAVEMEAVQERARRVRIVVRTGA